MTAKHCKSNFFGSGQVDVGSNCEIKHAETGAVIPDLYGIGHGFSLKTNDMSINAEQRNGVKADSMTVYVK